MKRVFIVTAALLSVLMPLRAQMRVTPVDDLQGHTALGLALRRLSTTGIFMMATAHPDDENNGLLVMMSRGLGYRTALVTATRGNGGQNEIGPELFEALGVLRTEELAAVHRFDGAEQYFTRAVDFGFSFSVEETLEKWGKDEIVGDFVRLIRTIRPDVITGLSPSGEGGGQHHQAAALIAREAFNAAGDPAKYPDQIQGGLRAWQPKKFYFTAQVGSQEPTPAGGQLTISLNGYDRLLGKTDAEVGVEARSMHKGQGTGQLLALPGSASASFTLAESRLPGAANRPETRLFDGVDTTLAGLAQFAGAKRPKELTEGLTAVSTAVQTAQRLFDTQGDTATVAPLLTALRAVRSLRGLLNQLPIDEGGRDEIRFRLLQKEREIQQAILLGSGVRIDALANDGVVVPGQPIQLSINIANRGATDITVKQVKFEGFEGSGICALHAYVPRGRGDTPPAAPPISVLRRDQVGQCETTLTIPAKAQISEPYWHRDGEAGRYTFDEDAPFGLSYRPTPFYAQVTFGFANSEDVFGGLAVSHRYQGDIFSGEKRSELLVVPVASVRVTPEIAIVPFVAPPPPAPAATAGRGRSTAAAPAGRAGAAAPAQPAPARRGRAAVTPSPAAPPAEPANTREIRVTVVNMSKGATETVLRMEVPAGWTASPATQTLAFTREDEEQTVRVKMTPAPGAPAGVYHAKASVSLNDQTVTRGFQKIEYPHIRRQHVYHDADVTLKVMDVKTAPNLTVGYIMGVGDEVPAALAQLGVTLEMIGSDELAWGNLSRFSTIVTGVRAYERRADLRANNERLLTYVREGGTLIVQYNKFEFNQAQYGPYKAEVSSDRVTDEFAPVRVLLPADPLFNTPNKVTDDTWKGWVQERGLYFLGERDSRYRDLVSLEDSFPNNSGEKRGALVTAQFGKGRWMYVGLALWRELPAGVEGAYQLLANLISAGR